MSDQRLIPARRIETEFTDRRSRFITNISPAFSTDEAQAFIASIKAKYPDATHHIPAYIIGHGSGTIAHCSDAGEPSGTAGQPALLVLRGSGLGDIVAVITRYFGGTKLGTGGLARAYSDSIRLALEKLPLAQKVSTTLLMFVVPYNIYDRTQITINNYYGSTTDQDFGADITLTVRLADEYLDSFRDRMTELSRGAIEFITIAHSENTIMPLRN